MTRCHPIMDNSKRWKETPRFVTLFVNRMHYDILSPFLFVYVKKFFVSLGWLWVGSLHLNTGVRELEEEINPK